MIPEAAYFLKVNAAIALFYAFYRLFFYKDTFFRLRRIVLLAFSGIAFLYPLLDVRPWVSGQLPVAEAVSLYSSVLPDVVVGDGLICPRPGWTGWLWLSAVCIYGAVAAGLLVRFLAQLYGIGALAARSRKTILAGTTVYLLEQPSGPFSFFNRIFIYPAAHTGKELEEILTHETTHARQWHSADVILGELLAIVCWINPFAWLLKREIRYNLEYLADRVVLQAGYDCRSYQYHLLALAYRPAENKLYNSFNAIHLKNRISMMNKARSRAKGRLKYLLFIPLTGVLTLLSNIEVLAREAGSQEARATWGGLTPANAGGEVAAAIRPVRGKWPVPDAFAPGNQVVSTLYRLEPEAGPYRWLAAGSLQGRDRSGDFPNEPPFFPGGEEALKHFIQKRIQYPAQASEKGIAGRVLCSLEVDRQGRVTDVQVKRSVDPALDAEALRVVSELPDWTPGKRNGIPASFQFTMAVTFRLQ